MYKNNLYSHKYDDSQYLDIKYAENSELIERMKSAFFNLLDLNNQLSSLLSESSIVDTLRLVEKEEEQYLSSVLEEVCERIKSYDAQSHYFWDFRDAVARMIKQCNYNNHALALKGFRFLQETSNEQIIDFFTAELAVEKMEFYFPVVGASLFFKEYDMFNFIESILCFNSPETIKDKATKNGLESYKHLLRHIQRFYENVGENQGAKELVDERVNKIKEILAYLEK